jgi:hypothetical protein
VGGTTALSRKALPLRRRGSAKFRGFRHSEWETKINYIAIAPAQYCRRYFLRAGMFSSFLIRDASEAVDHAVANLRLEVEDFLGKVAV